MSENTIKVWDPLVRLFHWSLVLAFFIAYFTEEDLMDLHTWAGYVVAGLVVFRLIWGFVGSRHARFTDFVRSPKVVISFLKDHLAGKARRYLGHNPAGGAMVIALLVTLGSTVASGIMLYGADECSGPLDSLCNSSIAFVSGVATVHELSINLTLGLISLHLIGVLLTSYWHKENLVKAMFVGRKSINRPA